LRLVTFAGMLNSSQCAKPTVVGASGSYRLTAKLCVPAGAPDQDRSGLVFPPPPHVCTVDIGIAPPSLN